MHFENGVVAESVSNKPRAPNAAGELAKDAITSPDSALTARRTGRMALVEKVGLTGGVGSYLIAEQECLKPQGSGQHRPVTGRRSKVRRFVPSKPIL